MFDKTVVTVLALIIAVLAFGFYAAVKADNECQASGGHTVTETTYGYRYTPGTTKWEYGPIVTSSCQH